MRTTRFLLALGASLFLTVAAAGSAAAQLVEHGHDVSGPTGNRPTNAEVGQRFYDTTTDEYIVYNGTSWQTAAEVGSALGLGDDAELRFGDASGGDAMLLFSTADASNHAFVLGLDNTSQQMHITDKAAIATDWARSAGTHPEVSIHSNTTPITDYLAIGNHDGTTASIDVVGGTTLSLKIAGTQAAAITAGAVSTTDVDAGASGTAGSVDVFPTTAAKGKLSITAADSTGDTTTTITNADQAGARTYTIPDAGASASFLMTAGAQTVGGVKTFSSAAVFSAGFTSTAQSLTAAADSGAGSTVLAGTTNVSVAGVTTNADDWIVLPALADVPIGHCIRVVGNASSNFEVRTPATSDEEINSEDADGTTEYLFTDTQIHEFVKISNTIGWMARNWSAVGTAGASVTPD